MFKYVVKRILIGFVTLFVLATATFFLMKACPGSPFSTEKYKNAEALAAAKAKYNLDKPVFQQYLLYLQDLAHGNLGESMVNKGRSVMYFVKLGFPVTARLGVLAFCLALFMGILLGTAAALSRAKWINNLCMLVATLGVSIPSFLIALFLMIIFGVKLKLLPFVGLTTPAHYLMPAISLALYPTAMICRLTRSSMLEVMKQDYIILARSKGTTYNKVIIKHALKNAMLPVITYCGPALAFLLTGSFTVESIFSIPGIGSSYVSCIQTRDYPVIMGLTIFLGIIIISFNIITDILSALVDPRIKLR